MNASGEARDVDVVEVAPRDGFQSIREPLPTDTKIGIIQSLLDAGCRRMEIGSFVSPKAVPQMADMADIAGYFRDRRDARLAVLVPNARGAELALEHGMRDLVYVFSASEAHNLSNVRRSVEQSLAQLADIVAMRDSADPFGLRIAIATAFDCPFNGAVPEPSVQYAVDRAAEIAGEGEIALCDTTGRANPHVVRERFRTMMKRLEGSSFEWAFHGHDTFGVGVANAMFAHEAGVSVFDTSAAGLGGCPFAPGSTGNTATEDLVFAFEEAGIRTGIHMERLLAVADRISKLPGASVGGHLRHVPRERAIPGAAART